MAAEGTNEFDRLAGELEGRLEQLVVATLERLRERVPGWMAETVVAWEEIEAFARASVRTQLRGFRRGVLPSGCPEVDAGGARTVAKAGELKLLLNGYWILQTNLWEAWLELVEAAVEDPAERHRLLRRGSDYFLRYAGLVTDHVADVYQRELEQAVRSGEQRRFHAVRGVLEGDPLAASQLSHEMEQHHLGLVSWGEGGEGAARGLAEALGRPLLIVGPLSDTWWAWLSGARSLAAAERRALAAFAPPAGGHLAIGLEAFGEAGFRATNRQALRARWASRRGGPGLVRYPDVAVEALAGENQEDARAFFAEELRGIGDDSPSSRRIRETLLAYFAAEHNAASAAAALGIHHQTVANRLRAAEERLGRPVGSRRVELEMALRLRAVLDGAAS